MEDLRDLALQNGSQAAAIMVPYHESGGGGGGGGMQSVTYDELVNLKETGKLVPGMAYRITDYSPCCYNSRQGDYGVRGQSGLAPAYSIFGEYDASAYDATGKLPPGYKSYENFDIIVLATSPYSLNENCRFTAHEGMTVQDDPAAYAHSCNLEAWRGKYVLGMDLQKAPWTPYIEEEGVIKPAPADAYNPRGYKGAVYWMQDEHGNEAPFDFMQMVILNKAVSNPYTEDDSEPALKVLSYAYLFSSQDDKPVNISFAENVYNNKVNSIKVVFYADQAYPIFRDNVIGNDAECIFWGHCFCNKVAAGARISALKYFCWNNVECDASQGGNRMIVGQNCTHNHFTLQMDVRKITIRDNFQWNEVGFRRYAEYKGSVIIGNNVMRCRLNPRIGSGHTFEMQGYATNCVFEGDFRLSSLAPNPTRTTLPFNLDSVILPSGFFVAYRITTPQGASESDKAGLVVLTSYSDVEGALSIELPLVSSMPTSGPKILVVNTQGTASYSWKNLYEAFA